MACIPSANKIAGNDDLLTEILLRLPIRPLLRFKSVSKHWLSLITNPHFCHRRSRGASGLFLRRTSALLNSEYYFIPLEDTSPTKPPFRTFTFGDCPNLTRILQSCNGLLCCWTTGVNAKCNYYIYNPTTHQFTTLPDPVDRVFGYTSGVESVQTVNLAFDPSKSPHYKAVCVYSSERLPQHYEIGVYSSETGLWRRSGNPFRADVNFKLGVFWKGAINWASDWVNSLYFNVDEERLGTLPMPLVPVGVEDRMIGYFGESGDHLHLIEIYGRHITQFNVYEMTEDYSGWSVKYIVDVDAVVEAFPEIICTHPSGLQFYKFLILSLIRRNNDEESFLVLSTPGKAIRYNFRDKTLKKLCDLSPLLFENDRAPVFGWRNAFQYIESLSCV
ncbi:unnamed protein product [Ilex paraguariensis]|uniref:F-box domain-containing protein n=1 Tax=Ilex paraguariensis TaxID=185542 RepID=A0ABC8QQX3_9AQUA